MTQLMALFRSVHAFWQSANSDVRLLTGTIFVLIIGITGLTPTYFGLSLSWPFAALIAATGWGSGGIAMRPMLLLILFGFAQDVSMIFAPLGVFALLNLLVFGLSAGLHQIFDRERSSGVALTIPLICMLSGFATLWVIASLTNGYAVLISPIILSMISTLALYIVVAQVFDLGRRPDQRGTLS